MDGFQSRVDPFVNFYCRCIANAHQLTFRVKQSAAATAVDWTTEYVVLKRAIISGDVLNCSIANRRIVAVVAAE